MRGPALVSGTAGRIGSGGGPGTERRVHENEQSASAKDLSGLVSK